MLLFTLLLVVGRLAVAISDSHVARWQSQERENIEDGKRLLYKLL